MIELPRFSPSFRTRLWQSAFIALAGFMAFRLFIDLMFFDLGASFPFFAAPAGIEGETGAAFAEMLAYPAAWSYGFALLLFALSLTLGWMDARRNRDAAPDWRIKRQRRNVLDLQREP